MPEQTPQEYLAAIAHEWGQYVAIQPIFHNGARAANPGDPIPASVVAQYKYDEQGLVAKNSTKAAKSVTEKGAE